MRICALCQESIEKSGSAMFRHITNVEFDYYEFAHLVCSLTDDVEPEGSWDTWKSFIESEHPEIADR